MLLKCLDYHVHLRVEFQIIAFSIVDNFIVLYIYFYFYDNHKKSIFTLLLYDTRVMLVSRTIKY